MIGLKLKPNRTVEKPVPRPSLLNGRTALFCVYLLVVVWALVQAGSFGGNLVNEGGWTLIWRFVLAAARPDLSADILGLALPSTLVTLAYAVCGTTLSIAIGIVGGIFSSEVWWQSVYPARRGNIAGRKPYMLPWLGVRGVFAVPRAIHEVIWGLFFINILGLDPLSAILAIGIPFGMITAKVFADILDETPREALHALQSGGVSPLKAFLYTLLPQAFPDLLSYSFYRLECAIRAAAVLGLIGAGGLGYQILLSLQSLNYEQVWTFLYLLILLSGITDGWSSLLHSRLHVYRYGEHKVGDQPSASRRGYSGDPFARVSMVVLLLLIPCSFWYVQADFSKLFAPRATQLLAGVVRDALPPNLDWTLVASLFNLSAQTLSMSILAMTVAGLGGLLLSLPAAANIALRGGIFDGGGSHPLQAIWGAAILFISRGILLVLRALSEGVWTLLALFVLFPGILPGAIGLGLYNLGVLGRLMAEVTENSDNRPLRALKGQGASNVQVFLYGVLPQTLPKDLAYILYRWEVCIRATVIAGLVGAGGLGRILSNQLSSFDYPSVVTSLIFYAGLTFLVDLISALARRVLR